MKRFLHFENFSIFLAVFEVTEKATPYLYYSGAKGLRFYSNMYCAACLGFEGTLQMLPGRVGITLSQQCEAWRKHSPSYHRTLKLTDTFGQHLVQPLVHVEPATAGCSEPHSVRVWLFTVMETPQPLFNFCHCWTIRAYGSQQGWREGEDLDLMVISCLMQPRIHWLPCCTLLAHIQPLSILPGHSMPCCSSASWLPAYVCEWNIFRLLWG